jgi:hypothetical protein
MSLTINQPKKQFLKEKLEKLNSMLATAKKLEDHIDHARRVLTSSNSLKQS